MLPVSGSATSPSCPVPLGVSALQPKFSKSGQPVRLARCPTQSGAQWPLPETLCSSPENQSKWPWVVVAGRGTPARAVVPCDSSPPRALHGVPRSHLVPSSSPHPGGLLNLKVHCRHSALNVTGRQQALSRDRCSGPALPRLPPSAAGRCVHTCGTKPVCVSASVHVWLCAPRCMCAQNAQPFVSVWCVCRGIICMSVNVDQTWQKWAPEAGIGSWDWSHFL